MKVKGRYVAQIEYDFVFDDTLPYARNLESIRNDFISGYAEEALKELLAEELFDTSVGKCSVKQLYFDMHELPEEDE